jgi:hypothetical protein
MHEAARRRLVGELIEAGKRSAKRLDCPRCGYPVIRGDDDDNVAIVATVDADELDRADEMLAVIDGRETFDLAPMRGKGAGAFALWHRDRWQLLSAREPRGTLHAWHECRKVTLF